MAALACAPLAPLRAQEAAPVPLLRASPAPAPPSGRSPARLGRLPGTVDVGVSAGAAHSSRWYDEEYSEGYWSAVGFRGEPGTVKSGTVVSAEVRYWPVPWAGIRLQAGRFNGQLRTDYALAFTGTRSPPQHLQATFYDASAVVRPLAAGRLPGPLSSAYAFAGAGSVDLALSGQPDLLYREEEYGC